jgi:hypothetical protein
MWLFYRNLKMKLLMNIFYLTLIYKSLSEIIIISSCGYYIEITKWNNYNIFYLTLIYKYLSEIIIISLCGLLYENIKVK